VKDLPDLALLGTTGPFHAVDLRRAIEATFAHRAIHQPPAAIPDPPSRWAPQYARMASENRLPWTTIDALLATVRAFLDPVLAGQPGTWHPDDWTWHRDE
jgi:hypothetical protein